MNFYVLFEIKIKPKYWTVNTTKIVGIIILNKHIYYNICPQMVMNELLNKKIKKIIKNTYVKCRYIHLYYMDTWKDEIKNWKLKIYKGQIIYSDTLYKLTFVSGNRKLQL